jgi:hypothetical protein
MVNPAMPLIGSKQGQRLRQFLRHPAEENAVIIPKKMFTCASAVVGAAAFFLLPIAWSTIKSS